jgi:predicted metal-dependent phosphoesterase TrpH
MPDIIRDFHLHTCYSDGVLSPEDLVGQAKAHGVEELAITDHNIISGVAAGERAARELGVTFLSGVELSAVYGGREIHILGYGFDPSRDGSGGPLFRYMEEIQNHQRGWLREVVAASQRQPIVVRENGKALAEIFLTEEETRRFSHAIPVVFHLAVLVKEKLDAVCSEFKNVPARHVVYFLFWRGDPTFIERYEGLFAKYGIENRKHWDVEKDGMPLKAPEEVIAMLHGERAFAAVAHPGEMKLGEREIAELASMGLGGVEVYTPKHDTARVGLYGSLAEKYGLLFISGTDYHDAHFRVKVDFGRDRDGLPLTRGAGAGDILKRAFASSPSPSPKTAG